MITLALREGEELCVCDLAWIAARAENLVGHHLRVLRDAGLATSAATTRSSSTRSPTPVASCSTLTSTSPNNAMTPHRSSSVVAEPAHARSTRTHARAAERDRLIRRAKALSWLSLAYMTAEGTVAITAAILASSVALLGFGLDSVIEGLASIIVIWRFTGPRRLSLRRNNAPSSSSRSAYSCSRPTSPRTPSAP